MDRFELENQIMSLHSIVDSLNDISYGVLENEMSSDDISNVLNGLAIMVDLKISKLFDAYRTVFKLDEYCDYESESDF